jgi:hypothetical protein
MEKGFRNFAFLIQVFTTQSAEFERDFLNASSLLGNRVERGREDVSIN